MGSGTPQERNDIALKLTENEVGNNTWLLDALQKSVVGKPDSPCFGNMKRNNRAQKRMKN
jgi:hypothetical protein